MPFLTHFRGRWLIGILIGLVVIVVVALSVRHFSSQNSASRTQAPPPAVPITAATATLADVPEIVNAIGSAQSIDTVAVAPRVTGAIMKVEFTPGQDVSAGQELFLIDPRPYQAALDQAKAQLARDQGVLAEAQADLTRYQTLEKENSIARQQAEDQAYVVEQDKGTVALDRANVEAAQLNLDFCHITSPIAGRAGVLHVDLGNIVGPGAGTTTSGGSSGSAGSTPSSGATALVTITQLAPIYVTFSVPQTMLSEILQNQAIHSLEVDAYSQAGKLLEKGQVTLIDNQVNTATGTVLLQATFVNKDNGLWPGAYVSVQLFVRTLHNAVTVPASAVMIGPNGDYVYVIGADNKVTRVDVVQTLRRGGVSVIGKGVSAGQKVVTAGQIRLDNGTQVAIQQTPTPQVRETTASD